MRLGLIARADNSGLGVQCAEYYRHLNPVKTLVVDVSHLHDTTTHCNKATFLDRYPDALVHRGWSPEDQTFVQFLSGLDVVLSAETFYSDHFPHLARRMGVRTVLVPNFEFLRPWVAPDLWAAPSMWRFDRFPEPKVHLPVPIATDRFTVNPPYAGDPRHFLHIVGRPAVKDRNGTPDVLAALQHVKSNIKLSLKCQDRDYLSGLLQATHVPSNIEIVPDSADVRDYWNNYAHGDVLLMPRRFGGLCLPVNEALGAGMPVIMTDIEPNNCWLPAEWLVPARMTEQFMVMNRVDVYTADHVALAAKIDQFATSDDFYVTARAKAADLATQYSWTELQPLYEKVLCGDYQIPDMVSR